ncbi:hypothetical protein ACWPKO_26985 (plasmid) [Coraliomargarita sp. W4R53]
MIRRGIGASFRTGLGSGGHRGVDPTGPQRSPAESLPEAVESEFSTATGQVQERRAAVQDADAAIIRAKGILSAALADSSARLGTFSAEVDRIFEGRDQDVASRFGAT